MASPPNLPALLAIARELSPEISSLSGDIERDRRVPPALIKKMAAAGLFRMCTPRDLGGAEADVPTILQVIEEVARADGSTGWCLMIGSTSAIISGYLDERAASAVFGADPDVVIGGVLAPKGVARTTDGGFQVTGRWPFASGSQHCGWLLGGSIILEGGAPRLLPSGMPDARMMLFPASEVRIHDTWTVAGLMGTGSHDIEVTDRFVPDAFSISLFTDKPRRSGALYAFPVFGLLALGIAAVALGIARSAVDEFARTAREKTPFGARKSLATQGRIQAQTAEAEGILRSARAFVLDASGSCWEATARGGEVGVNRRAELRLAAAHAVQSAARAVDIVYSAGGGTSIYATSPLQRHFRDIHVVTQHAMNGPASYELAGRVMLGVETDTSAL